VDQFVRFLDIVDDEVTAGDREDARLVEEGKVNEVEGLVMTGGIWSGKEGLGGGRGSREGMRLREKRR